MLIKFSRDTIVANFAFAAAFLIAAALAVASSNARAAMPTRNCADRALDYMTRLTSQRPETIARDRIDSTSVLFVAPIPAGTVWVEMDCRVSGPPLRAYIDWNNKQEPITLFLDGPLQRIHVEQGKHRESLATVLDSKGRVFPFVATRLDRVDAGDNRQIGAGFVFNRWTTRDMDVASVADGQHGPFLFIWLEQDKWPNGLLLAAARRQPLAVTIGPIALQMSTDDLHHLIGVGTQGRYCVGPEGNNCLSTDRYTDGNDLFEVARAAYNDTENKTHERVVAIRVDSGVHERASRLPLKFGRLSDWDWARVPLFSSPQRLASWTVEHWDPRYARYCNGFWCAEIRQLRAGRREFYIGP